MLRSKLRTPISASKLMEAAKATERHVFVLLPGLDGTERLFAPLREKLEPRFDSMVITYPTDRLRSSDELSLDVAKRLPRSRFTLVAESFSGPVALKVAARNPAGLVAVVLSASFVTCPRPWLAWMFGRLMGSWCFRIPMPNWALRVLATGGDARKELCSAIRSALRAVDPDVLAFRVQELMRIDTTSSLLECPVPITYLNGTEDRLIASSAVQVLRAARSDVKVVDVKGPHMLLQAAPGSGARAIAHAVEDRQYPATTARA